MFKRITSLFGIIALATVIGFLTVTCDDGGGDKGGPTSFGDTLKLSGQVYLEKYIEYSITYQKFDGNLTLDAYYGGSGEVKNGKLSYTIGIPTDLETLDVKQDLFGYNYDDVNASKQNVKGVVFDGFDLNHPYDSLYKSNATGSGNSKGFSQTSESVYYVYVDNDVTISGKGKTSNYTGHGVSYSETTKDFSLALKTGWNAIYTKSTISANSSVQTYTDAISLGNPSLKWVLREDHEEED
jgi:hypothetical protein